MSFDPLRKHPRLRRWSPWIVWIAVAVLVGFSMPHFGAIGVAPAAIEVKDALVTAPRTARIVRIHVRAGDPVAAGDALVELDPSALELEIAIAKAELERARVTKTARELDVRGSDLEATSRLAQEAERASVDLASLLSDEKKDRAELNELDELIAKQEKLVQERLASAETRDNLKLRRASIAQRVAEYEGLLRAAREHEAAARERLKAYQQGRRDTGGGVEERVAPERAEIQAQEERVRQLEKAREQLTLKAPIAGTVGEVLVSEGDTPAIGNGVVNIVDDHPTRAVAWVDERAALQLRIGTKVHLRPSDRSGGLRTGVVRAMAPAITEAPARFRIVPQQPRFARAVYIALDTSTDQGPPLPGQAFDATFEGS